MSSFEAVFLHGVSDYSKGASPVPDIPNWKSLQSRLGDVQDTLRREWQSDESVAEQVKDIASDFDFDDAIEQFVYKADDKIASLHRAVRDACFDLDTNWSPDEMTRDQMVTFINNLKDQLEEYLPQSHMMKDVAMSWYGYNVYRFIAEHHALGHCWLNYTHDDTFMGNLEDSKLGDLTVKACSKGILRLATQWVPGFLYFTSDNKIVLGSEKNNLAMKIDEFKTFFEDWKKPTEEEIGLFDVLNPGADWSVFRYLRDYEGKNYISNVKPISLQVSVNTDL